MGKPRRLRSFPVMGALSGPKAEVNAWDKEVSPFTGYDFAGSVRAGGHKLQVYNAYNPAYLNKT